MQRALLLVFILAVVGGVVFLISQDDTGSSADLTGDQDGTNGGTSENGKGAGLKGKTARPSATPEPIKLKSPARALLIGKSQDSWNHTILMMFQTAKSLSYRSWFLQDIHSGSKDGAAGQGRGLAELGAQPTGTWLADHDIQALFLDGIDPNAFPTSFWNVVTSRVQSGRMGLYVRPTVPVGEDGKVLTSHPMLSHPMLQELLPVTKAALLQGTPVPGTFPKPQLLAVTTEGRAHPATRLVKDVEVSAEAWANATKGEGALSSGFCYPVQELAEGAETLVTCEAATAMPAIVATGAKAKTRVLWMGNVDFSRDAHRVTAKDAVQKTLVNHWLVWLVGQAD